jgi:hypothetical protein
MTPSSTAGASYQQELNLDRMFSDVAGFVQEASSPAQVRHLLDRCVRVAKAASRRGSSGPTEWSHRRAAEQRRLKVDCWRTPGAIWIKPKLVAQINFMEWTGGNSLRHPS